MPLETNLNVSPYFDDFNEEKNFHRVLFRPGVAVQARELNQLQTILQNQVERFGDNIYKIGTIIKGCNLSIDSYYNYIKILDSQNDGQPVSLALYSNTLIVQESSNLQSISVNSKTGFESQDPNLSTIYLKYINTGTSGEKVYSTGQTVKVFNRNRTVEDVTVTVAGTLYSNSDTVVFSGGGGTGAVAVITTDATGQIVDVSVTTKGSGYTTTPNVSITTATGAGATLTAKNFITELTIASVANSVGIGAAVRTTEGIIYQKGNFIRVDAHEEVLEKYSNSPDDKVVGFAVVESVVNSSSDSSLLDLATGTPNFSAPGANRLKLTPTLTVVNTATAASNTDIFALLEFQDGNVVRDRSTTQFNSINKELARRTFDESGNYVLQSIPLDTEDITSNTTHFNVVVGAGTAYVNGERVTAFNNIRVPARKASDTANNFSQTINTQYGSYVLVKELLGNFDVKTGTTVSLRSAAGTDVTDNAGGTPTSPGSQIGTAKIRSIAYDSGVPGTPSAVYKLYIFDVRMSTGKAFKDVRGLSVSSTAVADVVLTNGNAILNDIENDILVFYSGAYAVKKLENEEFIFRTSTSGSFTSGGSQTLTFGSNTLPYGTGTLTDTQIEDFIVIPSSNVVHSSNGAGTVATTSGQTNVVGTSTTFLTTYEVGDYIKIDTNDPVRITDIYSNTKLGLASTVGYSAVANAHYKAYPGNVPIDFRKSGKSISVPSSSSLTVDLGAAITGTPSFTVYHDLQATTPGVRAKTLNTAYVKLSTDSLANTTTGPWCIGIPDVLSIEGVFVGSSNTYSDSTTNYRTDFELDSGQRDNYYGLAYIRKTSGSSLSLSSTNCLLVKVKAFTHSSGSYISTESYPIDDSTTPLPSNKIRTENIPVFISSTSGDSFSLRDCVDFRPIVANTALLSATVGSATIDPSSTEALTAGNKDFPSPLRSFEADIESFLPRIDRVVMANDGTIKIVEGIPSTEPLAPAAQSGTMDLGFLKVAPYPSLSSKAAITSNRFDLKNTIDLLQTRRYTMNDIKNIENRIQRLEYYTLLNSLETNAASLAIASESNSSVEVFKNGFFVDSFDTYTVSNLNDGEFKALINTTKSRLQAQEEVIPVNLKYNSSSSSGVTNNGDLITLSYTETPLLTQSIANKERTLTENQYSFKGKMLVTPKVDNFFDSEVTATSVVDINIADPLTSLVNAQNEINARVTAASQLVGTNVSLTSDSITQGFITRTTFTERTSNTIENSRTRITLPPVVTSKQEVNNLLTSAQINPYVRAQKIGVYISGLRPGARHYVYFDNTDVSNNTQPCTLSNPSNASPANFLPIYNKTSSPGLFANNTGELAVLIDIPADTFTAGEKDILVMDVSSLSSETSATSKATGKFSAFSTKGNAQNLTFSTKTFDTAGTGFSTRTFTDRYTTSTSSSWTTTIDNTPAPPPEWGDPLAQTFLVPEQKQSENIFITSIDLFFKEKDSAKGVAIELRETNDAGYITGAIVPFSRVYKKSSEVNTSQTASSLTKFTFDAPVCLRTGKEYGIIIQPDGNSPDYRIWSAETGVPDVANTSLISNQTWGLGTMFFSTGGKTFTPAQDEDIKFTVNRANFTSTNGTVILNNGDNEYLTINTVSGAFQGGEIVAQMANSYLNVQLTTNTTNSVITTNTSLSSSLSTNDHILVIYGTANVAGIANVKVTTTSVQNASSTNPEFTSRFSNGDFIKIGNEVRQVVNVASDYALSIDAPLNGTYSDNLYYAVTPKFDVLRVIAANTTTVTTNRPPLYSTNSTSLIVSSSQKVVKGSVSYYNASKNKLYLSDSTSTNSTFLIRTSNSTVFSYIVGDSSDAMAKVTSVDNVNASSFTPLLNTLVLPRTKVDFSATVTKSGGGTTSKDFSLAGRNNFNINDEITIKSLTNEIAGATITKSFNGTITVEADASDTSPVLDINPSSILLHKLKINNDYTSENTRYGNAETKYVSKRLELAEGLDAEDVKVYLKAFRPTGTEIKVYVKVLNSADNEPFNEKDWSELQMTTSAALYSSSLDENDLKEYEYTFKKSPSSTILVGRVESNSSGGNVTITGTGTSFNTDLTTNDIVKIVYTNSLTDYDIIPVSTIGGATTLTLASTPSTSSFSATIEKVTNKKEAFKYNKNSNVVRYFDASRGAHDTYKFMAVKIVLLSAYKYIAPQVDDIRVIAISV